MSPPQANKTKFSVKAVRDWLTGLHAVLSKKDKAAWLDFLDQPMPGLLAHHTDLRHLGVKYFLVPILAWPEGLAALLQKFPTPTDAMPGDEPKNLLRFYLWHDTTSIMDEIAGSLEKKSMKFKLSLLQAAGENIGGWAEVERQSGEYLHSLELFEDYWYQAIRLPRLALASIPGLCGPWNQNRSCDSFESVFASAMVHLVSWSHKKPALAQARYEEWQQLFQQSIPALSYLPFAEVQFLLKKESPENYNNFEISRKLLQRSSALQEKNMLQKTLQPRPSPTPKLL